MASVDSRCCQQEKKQVNLMLFAFCILAAKHYNVVTDSNFIDHCYLKLVFFFFPIKKALFYKLQVHATFVVGMVT